MELVPEMAQLGVFGPSIKGYGCGGLGSIAAGLMMQELERGDSGLRTFASVQGSLAMMAISLFGSEEQKNRWLPAMARGEKLGCFALTEPDFGSNPGGLRCLARKTADGYRLTGAKKWIGNGTIADVAVVWAKVEGEGASIPRENVQRPTSNVQRPTRTMRARSADSWLKRARRVSRRHSSKGSCRCGRR